MSGFITKVEVLANEALIRSEYGDDVFEAALKASGTTFLGLLIEMGKI